MQRFVGQVVAAFALLLSTGVWPFDACAEAGVIYATARTMATTVLEYLDPPQTVEEPSFPVYVPSSVPASSSGVRRRSITAADPFPTTTDNQREPPSHLGLLTLHKSNDSRDGAECHREATLSAPEPPCVSIFHPPRVGVVIV